MKKLELNGGLDKISKIMIRHEIELLPIVFEHIKKLMSLDLHHRDPFDRIIISQGLVENLTVVTKDENFPKYNIKIAWN